jgi:hypothetical protein
MAGQPKPLSAVALVCTLKPGPAPASSAEATATSPVRLSGDAINYNLEIAQEPH